MPEPDPRFLGGEKAVITDTSQMALWRIEVLRIRRWLSVAWVEDDYGRRSCVRLGWSSGHAWDRTAAALSGSCPGGSS